MIDEVESGLIHFYVVLSENVKKNFPIRENSIFITLIEASQNRVLATLSDSALSANLLRQKNLDELLDLNLIKKDEFSDKYSITAQGIWFIEKNKNLVSESQLINYFQRNQFQRKKGSRIDLNFREKVLLLSMIAIRAFSQQSPVALAPRYDLQDSWKDIFDLSNQFLCEMRIITEDEQNKLYLRAVADHPLLTIFRRNTDFPKKTNFLYKFDKNLNYWLDMPENELEFTENLALLFSLIFKEQLTFENLDLINDFCNEIAHRKSVFVFEDISRHKFLDTKFDLIIKEALIKGIKEYSFI